MFRTETSTEVAAPSGVVWELLQDVPRWPDWSPGYRAAAAEGPLELGRRGTVVLANGRPRTFEVVDWVDGSRFSFGGRSLGTTIRFHYAVRAGNGNTSVVTLGHTLEGPSSGFFGLLFGRRVAAQLPEAASRLARLAARRQDAAGRSEPRRGRSEPAA